MTANAPIVDAKQENQDRTVSLAPGRVRKFDATLLEVLEISPYDLAVLKRYLVAENIVPDTTDEEAIEVVVTGEQDEGYNPSSAATATRTDTPLRDIPASITVVPEQVIEDRDS